jgi:beta-mannosidase
MPENHLWGSRDYFKSAFYTGSRAAFVSETGYYGCPSPNSVKKFIEPPYLWPYSDNRQWAFHAYIPNFAELMAKQINEFFGEIPDTLEEFSLASQITQAEAKKFFIENVRRQKPVKTGILWWNLLDGWPQFANGTVDWFFEKKLAYGYIKRSQSALCLMFGELESWRLSLFAVNDTARAFEGTFSVADGETGETLAAGGFSVEENGVSRAASLPASHSDKRLLLIRWEANGEKGANHYVCGLPPLSFSRYKAWLKIIREADA